MGFSYVRFGFLDTRADIPVSGLEQRIAMPSLDASLDRRAPAITNPVDACDANLLAGIEIYQANCASCHGDVNHPHAALAEALYPRAPQFAEDAPDMPENQNFYIIQHFRPRFPPNGRRRQESPSLTLPPQVQLPSGKTCT
jgi:hypothetical protein